MFLILAAAITPFLLRLAQITDARGRAGFVDLRGALADLALSLLLAWLIGAIIKKARPLTALAVGSAMLLVWSLLHYGNYEHIKALGSLADWSNAKYLLDETFVKGSALHVSSMHLLAAALLLPPLNLWLFIRRPKKRMRLALLPLASAIAFVAGYLLPIDPAYTAWRQTHFVVENLQWMVGRGASKAAAADPASIYGIYPEDLSGSPVVSLNKPGTNVLLVILEGISGAALDTIAAKQGLRTNSARLPALDAKLNQALVYTNFINHQRQTNRGVYSLLCGDLPKLTTSTPKMTEASLQKERLFCLPEALRRNGYTTVFIQAAPLGFMGKDAFAEKAGFMRFHGVEWFEQAQKVSTWGVDDKAFLEKSAEAISSLQQEGKPWFLTLLTSGTHHPFNVPPSFVSGFEKHTFAHAVAHLNAAVAHFLQTLEQNKVFENTLVIFTSDESFGVAGEVSNDQLMLDQAWGYLAAFLPSGEKGLVEEPFMQMDVALSVLDYLGYRVQTQRFRGRSVFRRYLAKRLLPFANTYLRLSAGISEERQLYVCREDFSGKCRKYGMHSSQLFTALGPPAEIDPPPFLQTIAARASLLAPAVTKTAAVRTRELFQTPAEVKLSAELMRRRSIEKAQELQDYGQENRKMIGTFRLFGDQYLSLAKGEQIELELEVEVKEAEAMFFHSFKGVAFRDMPSGEEFLGTADIQRQRFGLGQSTVGMRPLFSAKTQKFFGRTVVVPAGQTLRYRYAFAAGEDYERMQFTLLAAPGAAKDAVIRIVKAEAKISPAPDGAAEQGLKVLTVEPAGGQILHKLGYNTDPTINVP